MYFTVQTRKLLLEAARQARAMGHSYVGSVHVLLALGLPHEVAHGSLRLTLSHANTQEDVEYMLREIPQVVSYLRSISPVWEAIEKGEIHYAV